MIDSSGVKELNQVIEILLDRRKNRLPYDQPIFASQGCRILDDAIKTLGGETVRCEMFSLSPSHSAVLASKLEFAKLMPDVTKRPKRWVPR